MVELPNWPHCFFLFYPLNINTAFLPIDLMKVYLQIWHGNQGKQLTRSLLTLHLPNVGRKIRLCLKKLDDTKSENPICTSSGFFFSLSLSLLSADETHVQMNFQFVHLWVTNLILIYKKKVYFPRLQKLIEGVDC